MQQESPRSSEAQAASACVDSTQWVRTFLALDQNADLDPRSEDLTEQVYPTTLFVDARALYDAAQTSSVAHFETTVHVKKSW